MSRAVAPVRIMTIAAVMVGTAVAAQPAAPPPAPPMPRLPQSGEIHCSLIGQDGAETKLDGVLGWSEPRAEGRRYPEVTFSADKLAILSGTYSATWTNNGGDFLNVSRNGDTSVKIRLLAPTYQARSAGAVAVEIWSGMSRSGSTRAYLTGFCQQTLSPVGGNQS